MFSLVGVKVTALAILARSVVPTPDLNTVPAYSAAEPSLTRDDDGYDGGEICEQFSTLHPLKRLS